ncbi:MAG: hypothetical protein JWO33_1584 [Caulobacteraceae bacterium]|nr:hypothetical protein [Caulobacteraceae bacterium]
MNKLILASAAAAVAMIGTAAAAQPYGYHSGYGDRYQSSRLRDSDRDGVPDRREWNRDRDRDGRPDQYDRYDNRRDRHHRHARAYAQPYYGYGYGQSRYYDRGYGDRDTVIFSYRNR